jgi:6-phospho-beta-glucosidase
MARKIAIIGGGGVRTPLVIHALAQLQDLLGVSELALYDIDPGRVGIIAGLGAEIVRQFGAELRITASESLEKTVDGADFILSSIRVGGIRARARDERIAIDHGLAGQETTGPGGAAMALRTIPVTLAQARVVQRVAPQAWFINFTNPAGLITQALAQNTSLRVIGICDTPIELFHRIAWVLGAPYEEMEFDYAGLNHLGWVRRVTLRGEDITGRLLSDQDALRRLYPADLFDPNLIQTLRLIPTEYVFFYYSQRKAYENQVRAGASRGEEIERLNTSLFDQLAAEDAARGLATYRSYLLRRNASYMKLEAEGGSAFMVAQEDYDPFETVTGYHRIALDVITGLVAERARMVVVNVPNHGAIDDLDAEDVIEAPCDIDRSGAHPRRIGRLPDSIRGLVLAVKAYERTAIRAALERSGPLAQLALLEYPIVGQWELAGDLRKALAESDPEHLAYINSP